MKNRQNKNSIEAQGLSAGEIRELREKERIDSVYLEPPATKKAVFTTVNFIVAFVCGAVILVALYYAAFLTGYLRSLLMPSLYAVDDSSGFLTDFVTGVLNILLFAVIAVLFDFVLNINYSGHGRPKEAWGRYIKFILPAAFGSCLVYAVIHHLTAGGSFRVSGSILSQIFYYVTEIAVVPAANILLFLVLPSAVIQMLLTVVSDTKERTELPLIIATTLIMTAGLLGITPNHIELYGNGIFAFTLMQSAACSLLYHRTNVIRAPILLYAGVSAFYLALAALLNSIMI